MSTEPPVDAAIRSFARVMSSPPTERAERLAAFAAAWKTLRASDPREDVDTLAHRLGALGVPIGQALLDVGRVVAEAGALATTKAPARKAPARKAPARKAPARKAPARKAPATKAPATKAPATAPARKAPARKAPARKAPARKAPARKAPATKRGPAARKKAR